MISNSVPEDALKQPLAFDLKKHFLDMNTLILNRPKEAFNARQPYSVLVNGEQVVDLKNGEKVTISLDTDDVTIKAKLHWCGSTSKEFRFEGENKLHLSIRGNQLYFKMMLASCLLFVTLAGLSFLLSDIETSKYVISSIIGAITIYITYTLTAGRDSWISISEEQHTSA